MNQLPLDDLTAAIARIRGLLLTEEKVDRAVSLLAGAIKESMPGTPGTGVPGMDAEGKRTSSASTDLIIDDVIQMSGSRAGGTPSSGCPYGLLSARR
jgi:hypothetical protein